MLRDTLVFRLKCDKVPKDAIVPVNKVTLQQIYDLAKTEEITTAQMKATTQGSSEIKIKETQSVSSDMGISRPQGAPKHH